jgi:hypothetical protein
VCVLQCSVARFLRELASSDAVTFHIAQQPGLQSGATPTLLLMKDMLFQVRGAWLGADIMLEMLATESHSCGKECCRRRRRPCSRCWSGGTGCAGT